jgi:bifunctional DNA-binding transcriptional regulator/antitoxin component of YhaV-PrlF toxin-antitoxin module
MSAETDKQGRLYIPKEIREKYGERYHIVTYEDRIELIPVADDPLAAVRAAAGELRDASVEEIREDIEDEAKVEARSEGGR